MDGRKSFVFSWNKKHREIHEEALLHYFDPNKKGQKFEYQPPQEPSSQTLQLARSTELEMKAVEEDPQQHLSSLVSRIEIGREMGNRTGARPKESNTSSSLIDPQRFTLVLKTRLYRGKISYEKDDVEQQLEGWTAPDEIANDLMKKKPVNANLQVYQENGRNNYRVVVVPD